MKPGTRVWLEWRSLKLRILQAPKDDHVTAMSQSQLKFLGAPAEILSEVSHLSFV